MRVLNQLFLIYQQFTATIAGTFTANRSVTIPDKSGTIAFTSDLQTQYQEVITISSPVTTATQIYTLSKTPVSTYIRLSVNGQVLSTLDVNPNFAVNGTAVTWNPAATNGFILDSGDSLFIDYMA